MSRIVKVIRSLWNVIKKKQPSQIFVIAVNSKITIHKDNKD